MQSRWLWSLVLLIWLAPALVAQDERDKKQETAEEEQQTVDEQLVELRQTHRRTMRELGAKFREAEDAAERTEIMKEREDAMAEIAQRALDLADSVKGQDAAADILIWIATQLSGDAKQTAIKTLFSEHIESESLGTLAVTVSRGMPSPNTENMLRELIEKSPHDSVKGGTILALSNYLTTLKRYAELPEAARDRLAAQIGEGGEEYLAKRTAEAIDKELESLLEEAVEKYADVEYGRRTVGEEAESQLFVIKYLSIGKVAPDIEGEDIDGEEFKLSDYRGKVVVLDFWGDW